MLLPLKRRRSLLDFKILVAYVAGTTSGALLTAITAWLLSGFTELLSIRMRVVLLIMGAVFIWLCKHSRLLRFIDLPESRRQIPAEVFGGSLVKGAHRFGFELGTGVRTYVPAAAPYILLFAVLMTHTTLANAVLVGLGFGLGRAVPLLVQFSAASQFRSADVFVQKADGLASATAALLVLVGALILV